MALRKTFLPTSDAPQAGALPIRNTGSVDEFEVEDHRSRGRGVPIGGLARRRPSVFNLLPAYISGGMRKASGVLSIRFLNRGFWKASGLMMKDMLAAG